MKRCRLVLLFGLLLTFAGCNTLMSMLFGFREINSYDAEQCEKFYKKPPKDFEFTPLVCNEKQFMQVSSLGADSMQMKNLYQPLKIMYFHGNEPTLGFNLNWNYNHQFDEFPPTTSVPLDGYTVKLSDMQAVFPEIKGEKNYTVLVFWTNMLHKVSKGEVKTVYKNLRRFCHLNDVEIYLVNDDITMTELLHETE